MATNESFMRALQDAKSIAYVKEGARGAALVKRVGITDALQPKTRLTTTRDEVGGRTPFDLAKAHTLERDEW